MSPWQNSPKTPCKFECACMNVAVSLPEVNGAMTIQAKFIRWIRPMVEELRRKVSRLFPARHTSGLNRPDDRAAPERQHRTVVIASRISGCGSHVNCLGFDFRRNLFPGCSPSSRTFPQRRASCHSPRRKSLFRPATSLSISSDRPVLARPSRNFVARRAGVQRIAIPR